MKILISAHTYYPDHNGVQMVTQYMAEGLAKKHEVLVLTETKGKYVREEIHENVRIERIDVKVEKSGFSGEKDRYFQRIKEYEPDIFICVCTQTWTFDWIVEKLDEIPCKKVLYTHGYSGYMEHYPVVYDLLHGKLHALEYHRKWKKYYDRAHIYIEKFDLVTYLDANNSAAVYAEKYGLKNGIIMENAVDDRIFENPVSEREQDPDAERPLRYLYIANYDENKNQKMILDAFYKISPEHKELIFIGSRKNEYAEMLIRTAGELDLKNGRHEVRILYGLEREETIKMLGEADVFVCGSRKEQYPIVLCEAAAKGLPIITTDVGHAAAIPGAVIVTDESEMAEQMQRLYDDTELCRELGKKNREYALSHYRIGEKVREFEEQLERLME